MITGSGPADQRDRLDHSVIIVGGWRSLAATPSDGCTKGHTHTGGRPRPA